MSSHLSAYQTLFKTCLQLLLALICFLLFFAFMILPELLVSAPITTEASIYSDTDIVVSEISGEAAAEWQFHLQFPFVGSIFWNPACHTKNRAGYELSKPHFDDATAFWKRDYYSGGGHKITPSERALKGCKLKPNLRRLAQSEVFSKSNTSGTQSDVVHAQVQ